MWGIDRVPERYHLRTTEKQNCRSDTQDHSQRRCVALEASYQNEAKDEDEDCSGDHKTPREDSE
jgi:hypothetical protein